MTEPLDEAPAAPSDTGHDPAPATGPTRTVLRGRVVLPDDVLDDGVVVVDGERITWVGLAVDADVPLPSPTARTLLPGLVDLHCHGGGGAGFPDCPTPDEARTAVQEHLRHGTTSLVASLVTADAATLVQRTAVLAELADAGELAGIHLEGPFLSAARCGAQDPALLVPGDVALVEEVARTARGHLVTMTVAPDVPGVLGPDGVVAALARAGAVPSVGHTDGSAEVTREAIDECRAALSRDGARSARPTVTHLFNGMRPLHHRDPGPVAACLAAAARGDAVVELVADGVHVAPETARAVLDIAPTSVALVTDAMAAAGMADGAYRLGSMDVDVVDGVARLAGGGAIAGGTAHLVDVVRSTVAAGVPLERAVRAASLTPADVLGRADVGALEAGRRADVLVTDAHLRPVRVMRAGRWVAGTTAGLVPLPLVVDARPGTAVTFGPASEVVAEGAARDVAAVVVERLARAGATGAGSTDAAPVRLRLVDEVRGAAGTARDVAREAYRLAVDPDGALVEALTVAGLLHGAATLASLVAAGDGAVHPVVVVDAPRYAWRGLSVDVARHPLPLADLLALVDVAADLRLNVLHLHLTDDQGWRLEVPSRPALTERSGGTAVDGDPGGFLTVGDWRTLVEHAAARAVTVVPEIDLPGHVNAALHAYGELTPDGTPADEYTGIEVGFSRLHVDLPTTRPFLEDVLRDVVRMTPGAPVHIGGDEVLTMEREEYAALVRAAADVVEAEGRPVVAWQEAAKAPLTPGTVVQLWDERLDTTDLVAAVRAGARLLLSPASRVYLDMKYDASTQLGLEWAGHVPLTRSYDWDPDRTVEGVDPSAVVGVEAAVWSETTRTLADVTSLLLPRLAAVAEVAWTAQDRRDWSDFARRVPAVARRWDDAGLAWHRTPDVSW